MGSADVKRRAMHRQNGRVYNIIGEDAESVTLEHRMSGRIFTVPMVNFLTFYVILP